MLVSLYDWFWNAKYWFPRPYSWADLEDSDGAVYPHPKDLLVVVPLTFVITTVRYIFERTVGLPLSRLLGVRDGRRIKPSHNPILESFFRTQSQNPEEAQLSHLATQCSLSLRQVQRWFRRRRNQERPLLSVKFSEACWRGVVYFSSFFGGLLTIYNEPWFWKPELCWNEFPKQPLKPAIYWWYILEFGFYLSLVMTLSFDVRRKDFKQQIIHHFSVIILIYFSYCGNYIRIGTLVMLIHDASDILLEASKMLIYLKWKNSSKITFFIFAVVFLISRIIVFPYKVLYHTYYSSMANHKPFFGYYFSNAFLMTLQILSVFWSFLILHMLCRLFIVGKMPDDVRSDLEEQCTGDEQSEIEQQKSRSPVILQTLSAFSSPRVPGKLSSTKKRRSVPTT